MASLKCPECGGPAEVVYESGNVKFIKCIRGHYRKTRKWMHTYYEKIHPAFMIKNDHH